MSASALFVKRCAAIKTTVKRKSKNANEFFATQLRSLLKRRQWKPATLARAMSEAGGTRVTGSLAASWARGARVPGGRYVALICQVLEVKPAELFGSPGVMGTEREPSVVGQFDPLPEPSAPQRVAETSGAPYTAVPAVAPRPAPSHMDPEVWKVVYEAVVRAYEKMVQRNELAGRRDGLQRAIELVNMMIYALNEMGEDTRDLSAAALWLHKRARGEPPETEPPPAPPPKPESGSGT